MAPKNFRMRRSLTRSRVMNVPSVKTSVVRQRKSAPRPAAQMAPPAADHIPIPELAPPRAFGQDSLRPHP